MLSVEGIARALRVFLGKESLPKYVAAEPKETLYIKHGVRGIRPVMAGAILRGIRFTPAVYESFIDLQDKLHSGIGRRRQIVSMGTHDLDTVKGPFYYDALPADNGFHFKPLNQQVVVDGLGMMCFYESDLKIRKFLPLIREHDKYPVVMDSQGTIMSVPPIINSEHSKITLGTRNVFVDVTGTDATKVSIALNTLLCDFAQYCEGGVEAVRVVYLDDEQDQPTAKSVIYPDFSVRQETVSTAYINECIGVALDGSEMCRLLTKMSLQASMKEGSNEILLVQVPPTRSDIFHACDVMEDVAIAYGFNRIPKTIPAVNTLAAPFPLNKLTDALRAEVALLGFTEIATLTLCSHDENYAFLNKEDPGNEAVVLANPKTIEYQLVHTSLAPQQLKTIAGNKSHALPLKLFQICDVVVQDCNKDTGARNKRHLCASFTSNVTSGFEVIHGVLDRVMLMLDVKPKLTKATALSNGTPTNALNSPSYSIRPSSSPTYFAGRQSEIVLHGKGEEPVVIGAFGILHPSVLKAFEISGHTVVSMLEMQIEPFL